MKIFDEISAAADLLFLEADTTRLTYHSYAHTKEVSANVREYALNSGTYASEWLNAAGLFHDTGYLFGYHKHEAKSMEIAEHYLRKLHVPSEEINFVTSCIEATELGVNPKHPEAALLKDTDLAYGVTQKFRERGPLLRKEWELNLEKFYTDSEWEHLQLDFLQNLKFASEFGMSNFMPIVQENLNAQLQLIADFKRS